MLLIEKVQELQAIQPPLDPTEIKRRIEEWKKSTSYKEPKPVEVKTDDSTEKDPNEESKNNIGSTGLNFGDGLFQYIEPSTGQTEINYSLFSDETFNILNREIVEETQTDFSKLEYDDSEKLPEVEINTSLPFTEKDLYTNLGVMVFGDSANPIDQNIIQGMLRDYGQQNNGTTLYDLNVSDLLKTQFDDPQKNLPKSQRYTRAEMFRTEVYGGRSTGQSLYQDKTKFGQALRFIGNDPIGTDIDKIRDYAMFKNNGKPIFALNYGDVTIDVDGVPMTQSQLRDKIDEFEVNNPDYNTKKYSRYEELVKALNKHGGRSFYGLDVPVMQDLYIADNMPVYNESELSDQVFTTFENGKNFLDPDRVYFLSAEERLNTGNFDPEEEEFLKEQVTKGEKKYGKKFYDEFGKTSYGVKEIQTTGAAVALTEKYPPSQLTLLKRQLVQRKDKIVVLAQAALDLLKKQQESKSKITNSFASSSDENEMLYNPFDFKKGSIINSADSENKKISDLAKKQIAYLEKIVSTGQIPKNPGFDVVAEFGLGIGVPIFIKEEDTRLKTEESSNKLGYLSGDSEVIRAFNNAMDSYDIANKAIQINRNPLTRETSVATDIWEGLSEKIMKDFGEDKIIDVEEKQEIANFLEGAGIEVRNSNGDYLPEFEKALEPSASGSVVQGAYDLTKILFQFYILRRSVGAPITKAASATETFVIRGFQGSRFSALNKGANFLNRTIQGTTIGAPGKIGLIGGVLEEMTLFELANMTNDVVTSGEAEYKFGEGLKLGAAISGGGFLGKEGFKAFSNLLSKNSVLADVIYKGTVSTPLRRGISTSITRSLGGGFSMVNADLILNPVDFVKDFNLSKYLHSVLEESAILFLAGKANGALTTKRGRSLQSVKNQVVEEFQYIQGKPPVVIQDAAKSLGLDPTVTNKENAAEQIAEAAQKEVDKITQELKDGKLTTKEAVDKIDVISKNALDLTNTSNLNQLKKVIDNDPSMPNQGEIYFATKQLQSGSKMSEKNSKIISELGPEYLLDKLGLKNNPTNLNFANQIIFNEKHIQALLDGGGIVYGPQGAQIVGEGRFRAQTPELRNKTYKFLRERFALENQLMRLQDKSKKGLTETEKNQLEADIKKTQEDLNSYLEGGEKYEANQKELDVDFETALAKEKAKDADITITTSQGESTGKFVDAVEFKEIVENDGVEYNERSLAYTAKDGNRYINEAAIRKVRKISDPFHERNHTYFLDLILKDSNGLVTKEGMETIDSILETLTPSERAKLDAEVESRYDTSKPKEQWYEENITVMGELMSGKNPIIKRSKSFTESLEGLLPLAKNRGFENIGDTPAELANLIAGAARGSKGAEKRLGELAETRAQELKATEEATGEKFTETASGKPSLSKRKLTPEQDKQAQDKVKEIQELQKESEALAKKYKKYKKDSEGNVLKDKQGNPVLDVIKGAKQQRLEKELFSSDVKATIDSFVENRTKALYDPIAASNKENVTRKQFLESMKSDIEAMVVEEFKAKQPLEKFITSRGYLRANSLAERLGIASVEEGITKSIDDTTKQIIGEETTETAVETDNLAKKPTETTRFNEDLLTTDFKQNNDTSKKGIENKINETIIEGYKGRNVTGFKDLGSPKFPIPKSVAKLYADMFGIKTIDGLTKKAQNFYPRDRDGLRNLQRFLIENSLSDYNRLPKTISDFGKATGIKQTKLGKIMYNDKGAKVGTAKQYRDIMQGKNITLTVQNGNQKGQPIEFNKPVKDISRGDLQQNLKTAWDFHVKNRALETLVPEQGKRIQAGAKFSQAKDVEKVLKISERRRLEKELKTIVGQLRTIARDVLPKGVELPDISTIEGRQAYVDFLITDYFPKIMEIFGADAITVTKSTDVSPGGNRILFTRKDGTIAGALAEGQLGVSDATKKDLVGKYGKEFAKENKELADAGLVFEQKNIKELIPEGKVDPDIEVATRQQKTKDLQRNLDSIQEHQKGFKKVLNKFKEVFDSDPKMMQGMIIHMYNANANYSFYRNLAQLIGKEAGIKQGWEEHAYQAGNFALRTLQAMTSKNPKTWENWLNWASEKYVQQTLGKESVKAIDKNYRENRYSDANPAPKWLPELKLDGVYASKSAEHPLLKKAMDEAMKTGDFSKVPDPRIRYYNEYLSLNPNLITNKGVTDAKEYNVEVPKEFQLNPNVYKYQGQLIYQQILTKAGILKGNNALTSAKAKELINYKLKSAKTEAKQATTNNELIGRNLKIDNSKIEASDAEVVINELKTADAALENSRSLNIKDGKPVEKEKRKIRIFDFDDTLARSNSKVLVEMPDGKTFKINATQFAERAAELEKDGARFDFSEFSKVVEGKKGPLFEVAKKIADARGTEDLFVLTARPADAAGPIKEFLKALGIDIPLKNITGLADGKASAKGRWVMDKVAEGYNDFYFADDAIKNVKAVKEVLDQADVKGKVQQAKFSKAKNFDKIFNNIIEAKTGIESYKQFSAAKAKTIGANKGKFGFFIPASAEDFTGLLYRTLGKGKVGDAQMAFYKENLLDPYNRAEMAISQAKVAAGRDYKELKKQFKNIPKTLEKETGISKFKYQHAIRTYIWDKQGLEVPGLSKRDQKRLVDFVSNDAELSVFADNLITIQKGRPYPEPNKDWTAGTITTDVIGGINKINRAEYLKEWQENVDIIFSEKNMNKLEAAFGPRYVEALKNSLAAMKSGSNRPLGGDRISNRILDWVNNSIGAVMFLNTRSAVLQTISSVNFINWGDNNLYAAGKAFGNQKQYWKDFLTLMNSDYLLERRDGLKINVSESEIADAVENSKNKVTAAISYLLNKGFVFTRYADSFAIASGGATFYRNRIKSLMKEGMSQELAEQQAFEDFRLIAEENQQSSSPMRISQQQRSTIGRMVLAFGNTQMQYARIQKRAIQDLVNKRGDWKSNISKIVYYGAIQNLMFNGLQSALGWSLFDDDEDEKAKGKRREQKLQRTLNGMIDSQLKGLGIAGAVTAGVKNALMTIAEEAGKKSPKFEEAIDDLINVMPAIGSKVRKIKSAARTMSWNRKEIKEKGFSLDNPAYLAGAQVISGFTNIPVDEAAMKINTMRNILNPYTEAWQKVALALGWSTWDVDLPYWGLAEEKPVLTETEKQTKKLFDLNKSNQVKMLLDLGLTKKQIRALTKEEQRVQEIIKLQNKKKDGKDKS